MKLPCYLVRDLLPLYQDDICDPQTAADVRAHLENCPDCRALGEKMQAAGPLEGETVRARQRDQAEALRRVGRAQRRNRRRMVLAGMLATLFGIALAGWLVYRYASRTYSDYDVRIIREMRYEAQGKPGDSPFSGEGLYVSLADEASCAVVPTRLVETEEGTAVAFTLECTLWNQWLYTLLQGPASGTTDRTAVCTAGGYGQTTVESLDAAYYLPYHAFMAWFYQSGAPLPEEAVLVWQADAP